MSGLRQRNNNNNNNSNNNNNIDNKNENSNGNVKESKVSFIAEWSHAMFDQVPAHSIAAARIFWGLVMMWEVYSYMQRGYAKAYVQLVQPPFLFHYYGFDWVPRLVVRSLEARHQYDDGVRCHVQSRLSLPRRRVRRLLSCSPCSFSRT
jgi:hypothetical protein